MTILLVLIPISLILLGLAIAAFVWAVRRGQYDDLDTPALDVLLDDDAIPQNATHHDKYDAAATRDVNISAQTPSGCDRNDAV